MIRTEVGRPIDRGRPRCNRAGAHGDFPVPVGDRFPAGHRRPGHPADEAERVGREVAVGHFHSRSARRSPSPCSSPSTARRGAALVQFEEKIAWIGPLNASYHLGVDGLSLPLMVLTAFLGLVVVLISWKEHLRVREYFAWLLLLETSILGVFTSLDLLLFFIFWEIEVIPMYFLISIWGSGTQGVLGDQVRDLHAVRQRVHAGRHPQPLFHHRQPEHHGAFAAAAWRWCRPVLPAAAMFFLLLAGSPSSCRSSRCTPGCRTPIPMPRPPAASCWPASSSRWAATA